MPIRRQHRWLYPLDWPQISASIRFVRAKGHCEPCSRPHGRLVVHRGDGRWWDEDGRVWRNGRERALTRLAAPLADDPRLLVTKVFLATAHLNHDPGDNRLRNLRAFCQRRHMLHDREEHRRRRWLTYRMRKALGDLFLGPYPTKWRVLRIAQGLDEGRPSRQGAVVDGAIRRR